MKILSARTRTYNPRFILCFTYIGANGSGCSFECDKEGKVDLGGLNPAALATYNEAMSGTVTRCVDQKFIPIDDNGQTDYVVVPGTGREVTYSVSKGEVQDVGSFHVLPAVGKCNHCGRRVFLESNTNTCMCGVEYNMSGQELGPRSQWGEETGESLSDILGATHPAGWHPSLDDIYFASPA